uniref:FYVE-type domain-containing protein n=1 Tax=Peronospora matthiolae TaxID=2874970 RepID=A0AAV1T797_9STRA
MKQEAQHDLAKELSPEETAALLTMSDSFVQETVHMSRHYVGCARHPNVVDSTRWKRVARFRNLCMYEERRKRWSPGSTNRNSTRKLGSRLADYDVAADDVRLLPATLLVGTFPGDLESVMFGLQSCTEDATRLRASCLGDNIVDERLLVAPLESSGVEDPLHSCTLRWRGLRYGAALASGTIFRSRSMETVYIESTGITRLDDGERVGYELLQSVTVPDLDGTGRLERKQAVISFCYVYRQPSPDVVEVFMLGSTSRDGILLGGALAKMHSLHRVMRCAELKKLAWLLNSSNPTLSNSKGGGCCAECFRSFSRWPHRAERQCSACDERVCASCTAYRQMRFAQPCRRKVTSAKLAFCGRCLQRAEETSPVMIAVFEAIEDGKHLSRSHFDTIDSSQPPLSHSLNWSKNCLEIDDELVMTILGD